MIDIALVRDDPERVKEFSRAKGYEVDVDGLLTLDAQRRELLQQIDDKRRERNESIAAVNGQRPSDEQIQKGRYLREEIDKLETQLQGIEPRFTKLLKSIPNAPLADVPVGASEDENVVAKTVGEPTKFDFEPKNHWQLAEPRDWIDKERAAKVAGSRFAYIKGDLVKLQFAIVQWVLDTLTSEAKLKQIIADNNLTASSQPFTPILPPAMIRTDVYEAMDRLEPRDDRYQVGEKDDDLWLQGSAEHTIGSMFMNEILPANQGPHRFVGYLTSFRREAGTYGKDTEGIFRMHQFDKLEMESFSAAAEGLNEHLLMVAIQEYFVSALKLPYRLLNKCTADIGKPNARGIDIDVWFPGQGKYRETHTADYMTDYQARRLSTRIRTDAGTELVHTNDATAFALGRTMAAIIENYQTKDGNFSMPEVLKTYMGGLS